MSRVTPVCFLYEGFRSCYNSTMVNALNAMLERNYVTGDRNDMVCITDNPKGIKCRTYPLSKLPPIQVRQGQPNNYNKLRIFDPETACDIGEKILLLDLDVLILDSINSIITDDDFRVVKGKYAPYNTSMMLLKAGHHAHVWNTFDPATVERTIESNPMCRYPSGKRWCGSDQIWVSLCVQNAKTWSEEDGVVSFHDYFEVPKRTSIPSDLKMVYFAGPRKPWNKFFMFRCLDLYNRYMWYWRRGNG